MVKIYMKRKCTGVTLKWRESDGGGEIVKMHFRRSIARAGRRDAYGFPDILSSSFYLATFVSQMRPRFSMRGSVYLSVGRSVGSLVRHPFWKNREKSMFFQLIKTSAFS